MIDALPTDCHPMDVCRTAISVLGAQHPKAEDASPEAELEKSKALFAAMPAVVCYDQRRRHGQELVDPREDLDYAQNFLWMAFGEEAAPEVVEEEDPMEEDPILGSRDSIRGPQNLQQRLAEEPVTEEEPAAPVDVSQATLWLVGASGGVGTSTLAELCSEQVVDAAVAAVREHPQTQAAWAVAQQWANDAVDALDPLPDSVVKRALASFAQAVVSRDV